MYCNQCGQAVSENSRFCNYCGSPVAPTGGQPLNRGAQARSDGPLAASAYAAGGMLDEQVIFTVRPTLIFVMAWYILAVLAVLIVSALMGWLNSLWPQWFTGWVAFITILAIGLMAFAIPVYKHVMRRREVYTLTNHKLELRRGLIAKTVMNIPIRNIQEVTVMASVRQRLLKIGDVIIESASEMGTTKLAEVRNPDHYAGLILSEMRRRN